MTRNYQTSTQSYISGLRWSGLEPFLFDVARRCNVRVHIDYIDKGILRHKVYYTVRGDRAQIGEFFRIVRLSVDDYNNNESF